MSTETIHIENESSLRGKEPVLSAVEVKQSHPRIPKLRFKEFEGEWIILKLREVAKIERGRFSPRPRNNPIYYHGDIPFVQTSDVVNANGKIEVYTQTLNEKGLAVSKLFPAGTILITIAANIGHVGVLQIDMACPDSLIGIKPNIETHNYFLNYYLSTQQEKMDYLAPEGAQKNINIDFLNPYKVPITSLPEQQKIASFLSAVDEKIQQLSQKKALLEQYKKGVMQQLFSGKLRFKDDKGNAFPDWEEKRLGEIASIKMGQSPESKSYNIDSIGMFLIQGNADINGRVTAPRQWTSEPTKICKVGDLILTVRAPVGSVSKSMHHACIGRGVCSIVNKKLSNQEYLFQFLLSYEEKWVRLEQGSTFTAVNGSDINGIKLNVPCLEEQQKIANYLSAIDTKIESVNQQITQTQSFKKGLLQQLFV